MDIPEKLATRRGETEQKQKHNKICVGNLCASKHKQRCKQRLEINNIELRTFLILPDTYIRVQGRLETNWTNAPNWAPHWYYLLWAVQVHTTTHRRFYREHHWVRYLLIPTLYMCNKWNTIVHKIQNITIQCQI